jgi:hypothetical protein
MVVSAAGSDCKEFVSVAGQNYVLVAYFTLNYSAISQIVQRKSLCEIEMIRIPHSNDLPVEVARRIWQRSQIPELSPRKQHTSQAKLNHQLWQFDG